MEDKRYELNTGSTKEPFPQHGEFKGEGFKSKYEIKASNVGFTFLNSGDIFEIVQGEAMINQMRTNAIDGSMNNLFLRLHTSEGIKSYPLLGVKSTSEVSFSEENSQVQWQGEVEGVKYTVTFTLTDKAIWFWDVKVEANDIEVDVIYGQDLGLAHRGMVQSNEAYACQYIDYKVFNDEAKGYVVCSRQNQPQAGGKFPYIQQGSLTKAKGYSTDGYQFFGLSYKETNVPEVLSKENLANTVYQYEFGYVALQSEKATGNAQFVFYGIAKEDQALAITDLEFGQEVTAAWDSVKEATEFVSIPKVKMNPAIGAPLKTIDMEQSEIEAIFPVRRQEEKEGNELLSFFTETNEHVVLKEKEMIVERSHGHVILSGNHLEINEEIITSTSYIYGLFNAQIVVGNTTMNKMLSNARNSLNVMKTSGQRIYVEIEGQYHLLTMPSMYELGFNYARWYYKTNDEMFIVTNYTTTDAPELRLNVKTKSGKAYKYFVTNQVIMSDKEYEVPFTIKHEGQTLSFFVDNNGFISNYYPNLCYHMHVEGAAMDVTDESKLASHVAPLSASLIVLDLEETNDFTITVQGYIHGGEFTEVKRNFETEVEKYRQFFSGVMNGFNLSLNGTTTDELEKMNLLMWWYTQNMFVHYLVPHGLEQYGGAAWGTRDVCQGPMEYFMAMEKYDVVRSILLTVFSHQFEQDGNWPQWFMFDKYVNIQAGESHGDIIAWPLKVIGDYLRVTKDYSILDEQIPYMDHDTFNFTTHTASLLDHVQKEIDYITSNFLHDTHLSCYGDGDWDDTLQPHDQKLKTYMASSWTVALTYQGMKQLGKALEEVNKEKSLEIQKIVEGIERDFQKYILTTDVIPGFLYLEDPNKPELMIHPTDEKTGIQYRLLPMQRSIISELFTEEQALSHYKIIKENLQCPDGVRLMNKPATYEGGVSTRFKRAEQASNFGREVGLQYVHAHIRFVEAMAKLGKEDEVWNALFVINPVNIQDSVKNAERRQSNAYFSSSDGKFNDRYEAQERFDELKKGEVAVKGGWRVYSSGPGIYVNQLISNCLGIRQVEENLVIDPIIPQELNGLTFDFAFAGRPVTFVYHLTGQDKKVAINGEVVVAEELTNRYRKGGFTISKEILEASLTAEKNTIDVYL